MNKKLNYLIKYCTPIFVIALLISCSNTVYKGLWQSQPPQVNGNPNEIPGSFKFHDSESGLYYTISNDLDNLYISGKTNNRQTQMSILHSGMQFCIDTTGKYGEQTRILFPFVIKQKKNKNSKDVAKGNNNSSQGRNQGTNNPENLDTLKKKFTDEKKMMHLLGFKYPIGGAVPLPNDYGIKMNISWDSSSTMVFQASIPFSTFYKKSLSIGDSSKIFGISMKLTGIPNAQPNGGMGSMGGMVGSGLSFGMGSMGMGGMGMGMGMGGMGMGGMGMGMGGMGMNGMGMGIRIPMGGNNNGMGNSTNQPNSNIKTKIKLALKPEN